MRYLLTAATLAAAFALAGFDAPRANGAYTTIATPNADACAHLCAADGLCMAWTYAEDTCALRATVPASQPAVAFGLSPRAPRFLHPAPPASPAPVEIAVTPEPARAPVARETIETAMLLGGPEDEPSNLRPAFGGSR